MAVAAEVVVVDRRVLKEVGAIERPVDAPREDLLHAAVALELGYELGVDELVRPDHEHQARPELARGAFEHALLEIDARNRQPRADLAPSIPQPARQPVHGLEKPWLPAALDLTVETVNFITQVAKSIGTRHAERNHVVAEEVADQYAFSGHNVRLLNPQIRHDLDQGKPLRIDIGSGPRPRPGFYALDQLELEGIDIVADLNEPLDELPDNCAEHIFSSHTLEHVQKLLPLLAEIHRIAKPRALIEIIVPHFSNPYYYSDPTHVRFFGLYTMNYFVDVQKQPEVWRVDTFYSKIRFEMEQVG